MRVLYHIPSLDSIYAHRTIYNGFQHAFLDLGHEFRPFTDDDDLAEVLPNYRPNLFITATHHYYRRYLDFALLKSFRAEGLFVLSKIDFWNSPISRARVNEARSMKDDAKLRRLMDQDALGDAYFHVVEQEDRRMHGFSEATGRPYHTVPLAADIRLAETAYDARFAADISYVGTALPDKRAYFRAYVYPLGRCHRLRIYGQDWTAGDRALGWIQRAGQYLNVKPLARIRKPRLGLGDEGRIYASSTVSINVHEEYQRKFGGDCNERTFKIPLCGGFEVVDNVACIRKYFDASELAMADGPAAWMQMVRHYVAHPDERVPMIEAGRRRVLRDHTYHNRALQMIAISRGRGSD